LAQVTFYSRPSEAVRSWAVERARRPNACRFVPVRIMHSQTERGRYSRVSTGHRRSRSPIRRKNRCFCIPVFKKPYTWFIPVKQDSALHQFYMHRWIDFFKLLVTLGTVVVLFVVMGMLAVLHLEENVAAFHIRCCDVNTSGVVVYRPGFLAGQGGPYEDQPEPEWYYSNDTRLSERFRSILNDTLRKQELFARAECTDDEHAYPLRLGTYRIDCMGEDYAPDLLSLKEEVQPHRHLLLCPSGCPRTASMLVLQMIGGSIIGLVWGLVPFVLVTCIWACCLPKDSGLHDKAHQKATVFREAES